LFCRLNLQGAKIGTLILFISTACTIYLFTSVYKDTPLPAPVKQPPFINKGLQKACLQPKLHPSEGDFFKNYFHKVSPYVCSQKQDWIETSNGTVYISRSIESAQRQNTTCVIQYVQRVNDTHVTFSNAYILQGDSILKLKDDYFRANCSRNNESYVNIHAGISYKSKVHARVNGLDKSKGFGLNVLLIGFDSMSHMTYIRKLPKTYKYLKDTLNAFILNGLNAIGDGTGENLTPLLTGKNENELPLALKNKPGASFEIGRAHV